MATVNPTSRETANRRGKAVAIQLHNEDLRRTSRMRNATILLAIVMLGMTVATHAFAAGGMGGRMGGGMGDGLGLGGGHMSGGFHGSIIDQAPSMPAPTFNPSDPYTVPQSPETPVSPASPGSVFGND
jgi:hypothetical protein